MLKQKYSDGHVQH